jgi:3-deoxy-D-manno-octulosonic-acid transferase
MSWLLDALYLVALLLLSPWLIYRAWKTGRYQQGLRAKLLGLDAPLAQLPPGARPVWFHGVSVGEIHLLRQVVAAFRKRHPDRPCVISTTTDTGLAEARKWFPDLGFFVFPFDFSWAVRRTLRQVNPALIVLAEGELWPNFLRAARCRQTPVAVINGRMSPRSYARYRRLGPLPRWLLGHLDLIAVQNERYAANLRALGVPAERVRVTGSVKFDSGAMDRANPRTQTLRSLLAIGPDDRVWIAGSTQAPEEEIVLGIYQKIRADHPGLRLIVVPRHPERFDEVAALLEKMRIPHVRRSRLTGSVEDRSAVVLGDTMGELSALWGLADLAFVGGSLDGKRGGQNMIEPAGCGAAVLFGPHVWNFRDVSQRLVEVDGAVQVADAKELEEWVERLLASRDERALLGRAGRQFVLSQQGATERTIDLLTPLLGRSDQSKAA